MVKEVMFAIAGLSAVFIANGIDVFSVAVFAMFLYR